MKMVIQNKKKNFKTKSKNHIQTQKKNAFIRIADLTSPKE